MEFAALVVLALVLAALVAYAAARGLARKPAPVPVEVGHQHVFVPRTVQVGALSITVLECACGERRLG